MLITYEYVINLKPNNKKDKVKYNMNIRESLHKLLHQT